ncbi:MAG: hypothetical protein BRD52_05885 [Bacteroidetes bacterium SW_4_67_19]|nr:MAG: hypothetical protein BRD52_05885 [Bacteroidetes bacterium SW_4_67_19]
MSDARQPAVFLDRDGTLNKEVNYLHKVENFEWVPGAPEAVKRLNELGVPVLVVTNQSGVARGYFEEEDVEQLHAFMEEELGKIGATIDAFYYCPYHPNREVEEYRALSHCRKPNPGMFEEAIREWSVDPARSFVVGDKHSDLLPGNELGMTTATRCTTTSWTVFPRPLTSSGEKSRASTLRAVESAGDARDDAVPGTRLQ